MGAAAAHDALPFLLGYRLANYHGHQEVPNSKTRPFRPYRDPYEFRS